MKTSLTLLVAAFAVLMLNVSAPAATFTLNPAQDAFVAAVNPTSNYGGAGALAVSAAAVSSNGEFDSLLQFNLVAAKTSFDTTFGAGLWAIDSITLQLTITPPNNPLFNANAAGQFSVKWMQDDSWVEGTGRPNAPTTDGVTFSTLPLFLSGADEALGSFFFAGGTSGTITLPLGLAPSFVIDATAGNEVSLLLLPGDTGVALLVNSVSATAGGHPLLTFNAIAVPEPGAFGYALCAVFASLCTRRRHHVRAA